jgi:hypothetical protein
MPGSYVYNAGRPENKFNMLILSYFHLPYEQFTFQYTINHNIFLHSPHHSIGGHIPW